LPYEEWDDVSSLRLLTHISMKRSIIDTIAVVDTLDQSGVAVFDTSYQYKDRVTGMSQSRMSHNIASNYFQDLPSAESMTEMVSDNRMDVYKNGIKLTIKVVYADKNYWNVFNHTILEGRTFDENDEKIDAMVLLVSSKTAEEYFGRTTEVVGEEIILEEKAYKVIGVFQDRGKFVPFVSPDVVLPYSVFNLRNKAHFYMGPSSLIIKKKSSVSAEQMKSEILAVQDIIPLDHPDNRYDYNTVEFNPGTYNEMFAQNIYYDKDPVKAYNIAWYIIMGLISFFIILPTLNLINLNVSRIMDRSSEIGVRKAFGAHKGNLVFQFIVENVIQTIIGGILGLLLAILIINLLNSGGYLGDAQLALYPKFFLYSFIATLIFGVLSGLIPALKMSNLQIVNALKDKKL